MKYSIYPDYLSLNQSAPMNSFILPLVQPLVRRLFKKEALKPSLTSSLTRIRGFDGHSIEVTIIAPIASSRPCLFCVHGGAFALPAAAHHKKLMCDYALGAHCTIVFVDYRLSPRFPFPYGLEDCYAAYLWTLENASDLGIDADRIGILGDSAGAALAASLTQKLRDQKVRTPLFQMLLYPVTDASLSTDSMKEYVDTPVWNARLNAKMWQIYLPGVKDGALPPYASPLAAERFEDLPPAYVEVSEFDCLRDEGVLYYERLATSGVPSLLRRTEGTIHGFELNYESTHTQAIVRQRIEYMREKFGSAD